MEQLRREPKGRTAGVDDVSGVSVHQPDDLDVEFPVIDLWTLILLAALVATFTIVVVMALQTVFP